MPTEPIKDVLPRAIENKKVAEILLMYSKAIDETVNFGTHVFKWCIETGGDNEQIPIFLLFRHAIELLDSISICIEESSIEPCKFMLRGLLEVYFDIEYIFQADTNRRAMSFLVWNLNMEIKMLRKRDPNTHEWQQFSKDLSTDRIVRDPKYYQIIDANQKVSEFQKILAQPSYAEAETEYQRLIAAGNRNPNWYSLFSGPASMRDLARQVNLIGQYEILYRAWSGPIHATDIIKGKISIDAQKKLGIVQIRTPSNAQIITSLTLAYAMHLYRSFISHYVPDRMKDYDAWYVNEIRDVYLMISGKPMINVT